MLAGGVASFARADPLGEAPGVDCQAAGVAGAPGSVPGSVPGSPSRTLPAAGRYAEKSLTSSTSCARRTRLKSESASTRRQSKTSYGLASRTAAGASVR